MTTSAQSTLLEADPGVPPREPAGTPAARRQAARSARRPEGRQMRLQLVPRPQAPARPLDARALAHAAGRLASAPGIGLVELHLHGDRLTAPEAGATGDTAQGVRLIVAPCTAAGAALAAFQGRTVVLGRAARSERLAGCIRLDGPWLWLQPLEGDAPPIRMPSADARIWGEIVTIARRQPDDAAERMANLRSG